MTRPLLALCIIRVCVRSARVCVIMGILLEHGMFLLDMLNTEAKTVKQD